MSNCRKQPMQPPTKPWLPPKPSRPRMQASMKDGFKRAMHQLDFNRPELLDWLPRSPSLKEKLQSEATAAGKSTCWQKIHASLLVYYTAQNQSSGMEQLESGPLFQNCFAAGSGAQPAVQAQQPAAGGLTAQGQPPAGSPATPKPAIGRASQHAEADEEAGGASATGTLGKVYVCRPAGAWPCAQSAPYIRHFLSAKGAEQGDKVAR
eukprot:scaffold16102_cov15-Tisochrysis_lutea.AAC.1